MKKRRPDNLKKEGSIQMDEKRIALFHGRRIRKTSFRNEWWFSIIDVIEVLVGGDRPRKYWSDLKKKADCRGVC